MRILCLHLLKNCKFKLSFVEPFRYFSIDSSPLQPKSNLIRYAEGDRDYIEILPSWKPEDERELRAEVFRHMRIFPEFVTEAEEAALLAEVEPQLKRMRYEFDHWDNAIEGYRETERAQWSGLAARAVRRARAALPGEPLAHQHVLDLAAAGHIRPHVDAVRFCGATIAGLCLLSSAVMRLRHSRRPELALDALLERRCLYVMSGVARYEFSHAVLGGADSVWRGRPLARRRRLAVICRERPPPDTTATPTTTTTTATTTTTTTTTDQTS